MSDSSERGTSERDKRTQGAVSERVAAALRRTTAAFALALGLAAAPAAHAAAGAPAAPAGPAVEITQDKATARTVVGERFSFTSTVRATGEQPAGELIAHLNIMALDPEVYVDPEDWSGERTQYIHDLKPGEERRLDWAVQTVNDGQFVIYVALASEGAGSSVVAGPGIRADVASQRVINAGGILPIALAVPGGLVVLAVAAQVRRRRLR